MNRGRPERSPGKSRTVDGCDERSREYGHLRLRARGSSRRSRFSSRTDPGVALHVSHAFHSHLMEPMLDALSNAAAKVRFLAPAIGIVSNVTGQLTTDGSVAEPDYWRRHAREAVRFSAGMQALAREGYRLFVEIGPSPTLCGMASNCLPQERRCLFAFSQARPRRLAADAANAGDPLRSRRGNEPGRAQHGLSSTEARAAHVPI